MNHLYFDIFQNLRKPEVYGQKELQELLALIQHGDNNKYLINCLRSLNKRDEQYDVVKELLPAVCWNVSYNGKRTKQNIKAFSGYMFFDKDGINLDEIESYKDALMGFPATVAVWASVGGKGLGCLVSVNNVDQANYAEAWSEIDRVVGIGFDQQARNPTQINVISYDPDIRINDSFESYGYTGNVSASNKLKRFEYASTCSDHVDWTDAIQSSSSEKAQYVSNNNTLHPYVYEHNVPVEEWKLNLSTTLDDTYFGENEFVVFENGIDQVKVYCPKVIPEGKRNSTLIAISSNLVWLNPSNNSKFLYNWLYSINNDKCSTPFKYGEVKGIVDRCLKKQASGELYPQYHKRFIFFNNKAALSLPQKRQIIGRETGKLRQLRTKRKIASAIDFLQENEIKVTQKEVANFIGMHVNTVKKYWNDYKEQVNYHL